MEISLTGEFFFAGKDVLEGILNERCVHAVRNNGRFDQETVSKFSKMVSNSKVVQKMLTKSCRDSVGARKKALKNVNLQELVSAFLHFNQERKERGILFAEFRTQETI